MPAFLNPHGSHTYFDYGVFKGLGKKQDLSSQ